MKKNEKMNYEIPEVTLIEVEVEKGFATSLPGAGGEDMNGGFPGDEF